MEDNKLDKAAQQEVVKNIMDRYLSYNIEPSNQNNNVGEQCLICTPEKSVEEEWLEKLLAMSDEELEQSKTIVFGMQSKNDNNHKLILRIRTLMETL